MLSVTTAATRVGALASAVAVGSLLWAGPAAAAPPAGRTLLVIGDSYSSGEGLKPFDEGTDDGGGGCHRSQQAFGHRAAELLPGVSVVSVACSGALIADYSGPNKDSVPAQNLAVRDRNPDYVALTMGGNDAEWTTMVASCASGLGPVNGQLGLNDQADCQRRLDAGDATVDGILDRLGRLYDAILTDAPAAEVKVLLYPPLFPTTTESDGRCVIGREGPVDITISREVTARMVALQQRLNDGITAEVDRMRAADVRAGSRLSVVDTVTAFGGHDGHTMTCQRAGRPTAWINPVRRDGAGRSKASLHPTNEGQRVMGAALASSFSVPSPIPQPRQDSVGAGSAIAAVHRGAGYWRASTDGSVVAFGEAVQHGNLNGTPLGGPVVDMAATPSDRGYWLVAENGEVFAFGDAPLKGAAIGALAEKAVGIAPNRGGDGYWIAAANGDVRGFGAPGFGTAVDRGLLTPVVGIAATPSGNGYWLVTGEGDVLGFGDASPHGSMAGQPLNAPMVGITATPSGRGYWLTAADGGVFSFGDAQFHGSAADLPLAGPVVGIAPSPTGGGYWLTAEDGGIFAFGDATFLGR